MKLSLLAVAFSVIFIKCVEQGAASEDGEEEYDKDEYDEKDFAITDAWENNTAVTFAEESNLKGNESFEESNTTKLSYSSSKKGESETIQPPLLDPNECGDPPSVKNAMIFEGKQIQYEIGAKVTYACEYGYITDGSAHFSECLFSEDTQTLYWTPPETRCSPRSCGDPGYVSHAHRVGSVFTFPNKVTFECDDGYALQGYGTRYCQTSGTWSGKLPTCEPIFCDPPENPENGKVSYSSLGYESELRYECNPGFLLKNDQGRICSANGTWTGIEPTCQEAQCDPPVAPEHGTFQIIGEKSSIGSRVLYTCDEGRVLSGSASSRCLDIGEWTFPTPKCLEPCFVPKLQHGKIGRYEGYYKNRFKELTENDNIKDGEELHLKCTPGFEPLGNLETEAKITCSRGKWETFPICEPAMCRSRPPPTENASVKRLNKTHGGIVVYQCKPFAKKVKFGNVTCVFGTWKGVTPVCKDLRCSVDELSLFPGLIIKGGKKFYWPGQLFNVSCEYGFNLRTENNQLKCEDGSWKGHLPPCLSASCNPEELVESEGIVLEDEKNVLNGEYLNAKCPEGYFRSGNQARCNRGQWTVRGKLCRESSCTLNRINNGGFSEIVERKKWNYSGFKYDRWQEYSRLRLGGTRNPGAEVYVSCNDRYSFQGNWQTNALVKCSKGKWDPEPLCLISGTSYRNEAKLSLKQAEKSNKKTNISSTTEHPFLLTTQSWIAKPDADRQQNSDPTPDPSCFCTYPIRDGSLVALVGVQQLSYGSRVKNNGRIKFHCLPFGYSRLNGVPEITCENCRSWHSSEFPTCAVPQIGDTILQFIGSYTILPGGIIEIAEKRQLSVQCASNGITEFPIFGTNIHEQLLYKSYIDNNGHYISEMNISSTNSNHSGYYTCNIRGYRPSAFEIQVICAFSSVNCPKFDEEDFIIDYDKEQAVNSTAVFYCKDKHKKVDGPNVVTCLPNGQWSGTSPKCKVVCSKINETEGMIISYTNNLEQNSIATFHCLEPRTLSGDSRIRCTSTGEWTKPPANCSLPSCFMYQLYDDIPENVEPVMEGINSEELPYNFSLRLTCGDNMMLSGSDVARCGHNGKWQISDIRCVAACALPITENSELVIEPHKSFYRFGESVSLSCSPGYVLGSEVVRLMCLGTSWSENVPECVKE